jgi:hypothetical protein
MDDVEAERSLVGLDIANLEPEVGPVSVSASGVSHHGSRLVQPDHLEGWIL